MAQGRYGAAEWDEGKLGLGAHGGLRLTVGPDPDEVVVSTQGAHGSRDAQGQLNGSFCLSVLPGALWGRGGGKEGWVGLDWSPPPGLTPYL